MKQTLWIDRTWTFSFPAELYPSVLERLRGTPARLEEALAGLDEAFIARSSGDAWSLQEHAGHLLTLDALPAARLSEFLAGEEVLSAADMTNQATEDASHNARPIAEVLRGFREVRRSLLARLDVLDRKGFARTALHPRLSVPMRLVDMLAFQADHDDHHLASMRELLQQK